MINHPDAFFRNLPAGFDGVFHWDYLLPIFKGTRIKPMDIDAAVERRGNFLLFETKEPGVEVPLGQIITLESLIKMGRGRVTVLIICGKWAEAVEWMEEWRYLNHLVNKERWQCDAEFVYNKVKVWWECVNGYGANRV